MPTLRAAPENESTDDIWYYAARDQSVGPISLSKLKQVLSRTSGAKDVLVWRDGFANWEKASSVPELADHVIKPPPLPAPPPLRGEINPKFSSPTITIEKRPFNEPHPVKISRGHGRFAIGVYVFGFLAFGSIIAKDNHLLILAFLVAAGTMLDIRISRLP